MVCQCIGLQTNAHHGCLSAGVTILPQSVGRFGSGTASCLRTPREEDNDCRIDQASKQYSHAMGEKCA